MTKLTGAPPPDVTGALSSSDRKEKTLRWLRLFSVLYFAALLVVSFVITYKGSYGQYTQNDTKLIPTVQALETMTPIISICRLPGFKSMNHTDLEDLIEEEDDESKHRELIEKNMLELDDVVVKTVLEKEDIFGKMGKAHDSTVEIGADMWEPVPSGSRLIGTCFVLRTSQFSSDFNAENGSSLVVHLVTSEEDDFRPQYIVQAYAEGEESLVGITSMEEQNVAGNIVKSGETGILNLEMKKTLKIRDCYDYTLPTSHHANFDDCLMRFMDKSFPDCPYRDYKANNCSSEDYRGRTNQMFHVKSDGYNEFASFTDCHLPCVRYHYGLSTNYLLEMPIFGNSRTVAAIRRFQKTSMTVTTEVQEWNAYLLITDVGGVWGLFLGVSFWSVYEWGVRPLSKQVRRKIKQANSEKK